MFQFWFNGVIYSLNSQNDVFEAMITRGNKIIALGTNEDLKNSLPETTVFVDLKGQCIIPSFIDSHIHLIGHGDLLSKVDFSKFQSKQEVLEAIRYLAKGKNNNEWLIIEGWNEENFIDDFSRLTKQDIDSLELPNPICAKRICRHCITVNSIGLEILNQVSEDGLFFDEQQFELLLQIEKRTKQSLKSSLKLAIEDARKNGITEVHTEDLNYYGDAMITLEALEESANELQFPIHELVHWDAFKILNKYKMKHFSNNSRIQLGAIKVFADGSFGAKTALLTSNYENENHNGTVVTSLEELENIVGVARAHDLPIAVHAIGDLAVENVLSTIQKYPITPETIGKDRLIHAQLINPTILKKYSQLMIHVDLQPTFIHSDFPWLVGRIGMNRAKYAFAFKDMLATNWTCSFSSDSPIDDISPLKGIYFAVTRKKDGIIYNSDQQISLLDAVKLYTKGANNIYVKPTNKGILEVNAPANFIVLDKDIFTIEVEEILNISVVATIFEGTVVYKKASFNLLK